MNYNCLIIDDEQLARELIKMYCEKTPGLNVVGLCKNAQEAMAIMNDQKIDVLFLDIQMPDISGVDFVKTLANKPNVIFTTAYQDYAIEGFELNAIDYLLKPIAYDRFLKAIQKIGSRSFKFEEKEETITLRADHKLYRIKCADIKYVEGLREYVTFYTEDRKIVVLESLKKLESTLPNYFSRVHKSYIVNTKLIDSISGNQVELGTIAIPVGKSYKEEVLALFEGN